MANNQDTSSLLTIKRTAIDPAGRLGALYDGRQDQIVETLDVTFEKSPEEFPQKAQCILEKGDEHLKRNPLELIGLDEQLRLSLLLNLIPRNGIAEILNHPHLINQYTRIFHYTYIHREETFPDNMQTIRTWLQTSKPETNATHIITSVSWGIDIVVVLQLPPDNHIATLIDQTLEKYRAYLNGDRDEFKLTRDDIISYMKIIDTKVYSNIAISNDNCTLHDIFHSITRRKTDETEHQHCSYTLCPLQWFVSQSDYHYRPCDLTNTPQLEPYLFDLSNSLTLLETYFNEDMSNLLCGHFKDRLSNAYKEWFDLKREYNHLIERLSSLIRDVRSGVISISTLDEELHSEEQTRMKTTMSNLMRNVSDLNAKGHLISDLGHQQIQYCNVIERHVDENDNEEALKRKLIIDQTSDRVLCSNEILNKNHPEQLKELRHALAEELERNGKLRLTYADFSYCTFDLPNMIILPFSRYYIRKKAKQQELLSTSDINGSMSSISTTQIPGPLSSPLPTSESINILLLGEIGVGKSTFINAFVNYITFNTFDKAHSDKAIVTIPVSFSITTGHNFEEHFVKSGDLNRYKNEDFDHAGQSVTQHCKSYVFPPNHSDRKKLRIIDTPGFGNARGSIQDDLNMQHILEYVKKLPHLNAICILLKANESELNIFLPSCLRQLFDFFSSSIRRNILFCFTNTRLTSYTPGDTATSLKDMLASLPIRKFPLKKKNTYCFDNESFRYLVARQNQIPFSDHDRQGYENSWTNSVMEANRLIRHIRKNLIAFPVPNEWEAIKRAQIEIVQMIHPILETIRHYFRDIIVRKINSSKVSIELHSEHVPTDEQPNDSYNYQHIPHHSFPTDFLQDYRIFTCPLSQKQDEIIDQLSLLCHVSAEFGYFLANFTPYPNGNPFLNGLFRLINEEKNICDDNNRSVMNIQLLKGLKALTQIYEQRMKTFKLDGKRSNLSDVHQWIKYMHGVSLVSDYVIGNNQVNKSVDNDTISM